MIQHISHKAAPHKIKHSQQSSFSQQPFKSLHLFSKFSPPIAKTLRSSNLNSSKRGVSKFFEFKDSVAKALLD